MNDLITYREESIEALKKESQKNKSELDDKIKKLLESEKRCSHYCELLLEESANERRYELDSKR